MKPVHIVILILAGALGGAGIMKIAHLQRMKPAAPISAVAPVQAPRVVVLTPAEPLVVTPAESAVEAQPEHASPPPAPAKPKPSPMLLVARREPPRPQYSRPIPPPPAPPAGDPEPVERPVAVPEPAPAAAASAPPVPSTPSPTVAPPLASTEPENMTPASPQGSVAPAPQPHHVTLNAGLLLPVRLVDGLSSERNAPGDVFTGTLDKELVVDDLVIAERGARVEGRVVAADRGGKVHGGAALAVELTRLHTSDGQTVPIQTESYFKHADAPRDQNVEKIAGGAVLGAMIGAIAGGGKGAAIGAGVGSGAGAGAVLLTPSKPAQMPSESRVDFRLKAAVPLTERLHLP